MKHVQLTSANISHWYRSKLNALADGWHGVTTVPVTETNVLTVRVRV
jgi:hypothetical protein